MSTQRTESVYLPPEEERCEPHQPCLKKWSCARFLAKLPPSGAKMADHSTIICNAFISLDEARRKMRSGTDRRATHPPVRGMF